MSDTPSPGDADALPEQLRVRREKRAAMIAAGVDPYPVSVPRTHTLRQIRERYEGAAELGSDVATGEIVSVTGRVIHLRDTGKLVFLRLREGDGTELQVMASLARLGPGGLADLKAWLDLGDLVGVTGEVVTSRRGELSVQATAWQMAAKALRPLPVEHKSLSDEARVRMRYADLIVSPQARHMVRARATVLATLREVLAERGFVEVETPVLQHVHGGAARPFHTHLNAFDTDMTLRISLELFLKRAVIGGVERVYEIGRNFRNEGLDSSHHAEFTMLEAYQAYGDYDSMAELTRALVVRSAEAVGRTTVPDGRGGEIDLAGQWCAVTFFGAISKALGVDVGPESDRAQLVRHAGHHGIEVQRRWEAADIALELFERLVEPTLLTPTFVRDYPVSTRPLARRHRDCPELAESWDLVIAGTELAPAYSELSDPVDQQERFLDQARRARAGDEEAMHFDAEFLQALEHGMPPTGGMGMGIDRLLRLLTGSGIRETILFPLVRPRRD